jgi:hypothetical protein
METDPVRTAEADLVAPSGTLTAPRARECLFCFVDRPPERPVCPGVGGRSAQPCATWVPRRRPR